MMMVMVTDNSDKSDDSGDDYHKLSVALILLLTVLIMVQVGCC